MPPSRLRLARLVFALTAVAGAAADWKLPPLTGDLSGKLALTDGSGVPEIAWRVQTTPQTGGPLRAELSASGPGLALRVALTPPHDGAPGAWQLLDATVELADWWRHAAARAGVAVRPADLRLSGRLRANGEGAWSEADWSGVVRATFADGAAGSEEQHWSASGIGLTGEVSFRQNEFALRTAELRVGTAQVAVITARNLILDVAGAPQGRLEVRRAQLDAFGGRLTLAPFTLDPVAPAMQTAAEFSQIALGELAALVPQAIAEARGQVAGKFSVSWSLKPSVQPGAGGLELAPGAAATFRLAESPGLLTGRAPPRIALLPGWAGPLRKWLSVENPAYDTLRRIELGQIPLEMENLRVQLFPDGPDGSRTAHVEVAARPTAGSAVERVTFSVNLSGPLTQVLRLGLDQRTTIRRTAPR